MCHLSLLDSTVKRRVMSFGQPYSSTRSRAPNVRSKTLPFAGSQSFPFQLLIIFNLLLKFC